MLFNCQTPVMKTEFKARPVFLQRKERIHSHFMTCFLALIIYRYLEKALDSKYTTVEITSCLRDMQLLHMNNAGYIPTYKGTDLTAALHDIFGFQTYTEIITPATMRNICSVSKKV